MSKGGATRRDHCRLPTADCRFTDCRLPSADLRIVECRLLVDCGLTTDCGLTIVDCRLCPIPNPNSNPQSQIPNQIDSRQSQSSIANPQSVNLQSALCSRQCDG